MKNFIDIDLNSLDIFHKPDIKLPDWKPRELEKTYAECSKLYLDIETTGLGNTNSSGYMNNAFHPMGCVIKAIGMKSDKGGYRYQYGHDEKQILDEWIRILFDKKADFLFTFKGFDFDLPFLMYKLEEHNLPNPFRFASTQKPTRMGAAKKNGRTAEFYQIHLDWGNGQKTYLIDLYHQVLAWDSVANRLNQHSLKVAPFEMGLREEKDRIELSFQEMLECYQNNNWDLLLSYLQDDLDDTERLAEFLVPSIYYQQIAIPRFNPQQLAIYGNGTKANIFLSEYYKEKHGIFYEEPEKDEPMDFIGGKTTGNCGFHLSTAKLDIASLYPTIMINYLICSRKDPDMIFLAMLSYLKAERLKLKAIAHEDKNADQMQGSMKLILNGCGYGGLATTGIPYNDFHAAAMVTAYGRKILDFMDKTVTDNGASIVNSDTDAVAISCPPMEQLPPLEIELDCLVDSPRAIKLMKSVSKISSETLDKIISGYGNFRLSLGLLRDIFKEYKLDYDSTKEVYARLIFSLPEWIEVEYEIKGDFFVPAKICLDAYEKSYKVESKLGQKFILKTFPEINEMEMDMIISLFKGKKVSLKIMFEISKITGFEFLSSDGLRKNYIIFLDSGKIKSMGKYRKRNKSKFQKGWIVEYLQIYRKQGIKVAEKFYSDTFDQIKSGKYSVDDLAITRMIAKSEVNLINLGLGKARETITFYASSNQYSLLGSNDPYDVDYYLDELNTIYKEIKDTIFIQKIQSEGYKGQSRFAA